MSGDDAVPLASDPRKTLIDNERIKLTATYVNGLALAIFAVGGGAPFIAALGVVTDRHGLSAGALTLLIVCFMSSGGLHLLGRWQLGRLDV